MLEKLETAYLAILRFVVIFVSGILLLAVVVLGFNSLKIIAPEPKMDKTLLVSENDIIKGLVPPRSNMQKDADPSSHNAEADQSDENMVAYSRAATAIEKFVINNAGREVVIERSKVISFLKGNAENESQGDPELVTAFATNFANSIEKTLESKPVIEKAKNSDPSDVVEEAFYIFNDLFKKQIEDQKAEYQVKQQEYIMNKANATLSLQIAAATFSAFLLIVFLSVIIKIERNLRPTDTKR